MDSEHSNRVVELLRGSLEHLSWPAAQQIAYLAGMRVDADELALDFNDWALLADQLLDAGAISREAYRVIVDIDAILDSLDPTPSNWDDKALEDLSEWQAIRHLASAALVLLAPAAAPA